MGGWATGGGRGLGRREVPEMKNRPWGREDGNPFKVGIPGVFGPRESGPHKEVWDTLDWKSPAICKCRDCGAEWPEGGLYPEECSK